MKSTGKLLAGVGAVLTVVLAVSAAPAAAAPADDGIEITAVDVEQHPRVTATVTAPPGLEGAAFTADMFEVSENGDPVDATVRRLPTDGLEVMLLLDTSGSMRGAPLESQKAAARAFLSSLPAGIRVGAVAYGSIATLASPPTVDRSVVTETITPLTAGGDTALYDAVLYALWQFTPAAQRRAIVLLADGEDNASRAGLDDAVVAAAAAGVPVHVIELVTARANGAALEHLAAATGGGLSVATDHAALTGLYQRAAGAVANQYRITYTSRTTGRRQLAVRVFAPGGELGDTVAVPAAVAAPSTTAPSPTTVAPTAAPTTAASPADTTTPPTTTPPTTAPPTTAPPTTAAASAAGPAGTAGSPDSGEPAGHDRALLAGGAGAFFLALMLLASLVGSGGRARERQAVRAGLGIGPRRAAGAGMTQFTGNVSAGVDRLLERRGRSRCIASALEAAGISLRPGEFVVLVLAGTTAAGILALSMFGVLGFLAIAVVAPLGARATLERLAARRRARFAELLPDNLQLLTSGLRSGYGLVQALDNVAQEAAEPAHSEFRRVLLEARVGLDLGEALSALSVRMASRDFEWVVGAIQISREIGGDLAATIENVAETIRERQRLTRQVQTLTAEGRLSAYVLTGIPVLLAAALALISPGYIDPLFSGVGLLLTGLGAVFLTAGWLWMKRLIRLDF